MLADEPDGMQIGDLVLLPHLPSEWRWSVVRITGSYRYSIDPQVGDLGHILPVEVIAADLGDDQLTDEVRSMRAFPPVCAACVGRRTWTLRSSLELRRPSCRKGT
jgi:hypothetical protein